MSTNTKIIRCYVCRDVGLKDGCPSCGKRIEPTSEELMNIQIPVKYRDSLVWDSEKLLTRWSSKTGDRQFNQYVKVMDALMKNAQNGIFPTKSMMFISEPGMGKHTFIYSLMNVYMSKGLTVAPMIDQNEYKRMVLSCADKYYSERAKELDTLIKSDFAVMSIEPLNRYRAVESISSLVEKRANVGKATYVISNYPLSNLENEFNNSIDVRHSPGLDDLRYLRIVTV